MWTTTDTVATVAAVAQVSAAAFTGLMAKRTHDLAAETRSMAAATRAMAEETKSAASATAREAKATETLAEEALRDRRPVLVRTSMRGTSTPSAPRGPERYSETVAVTNFGRGPAFDCLYVHVVDDLTWCFDRLYGLAGDAKSEREVFLGTGAPPWELFPVEQRFSAGAAVLLCEDVLGNRLRFLMGRRDPDIWRPSDGKAPEWASSKFAWEQVSYGERPEGTSG